MEKRELIATLALPKMPKVGCKTARKLIRHFGNAAAVFEKIEHTTQSQFETISKLFRRSETQNILKAAEKEVALIAKRNINWMAYSDAAFPTSLHQCADAPLVLFCSGQPFPNTTSIISIVGTRQPSESGKAFVRQLVKELAAYQPIIVSGFAYGIDIEAQLAALDNGLVTYGCFGHGILGCYPKERAKYRKRIEETGGFLSEVWANEPFRRAHFLQRNRIIAGLAQATIVVESREKGGALTTAHYANSYQRDVFAAPGRPNDVTASGCLELIKTRQAECITSGEDVARALGWKQRQNPIPRPKLFIELNEKEKQVISHMSGTPKHIDLIALEAKLKVSEIASILFQLEMKGAVMAQAGKQFKTI